MSRLAPLDRALVLILVPLWAVCFAIGLRTQIAGGGYAGVGLILEGPDAYPALTGDFQRAIHGSDPLAPAGLLPGDRLIRLGDADLRGVGTLGFAARSADLSGLDAPLVFEREGQRRETSLTLAPVSVFRPTLGASLAFAVSGLFLLLRGQRTPTVRAAFHSSMGFAFANCTWPGTSLEFYTWFGIWVVAALFLHPLAFRFLFRFPDDRVPAGRWHAIWPWFFAIPGVLFTSLLFSRWAGIAEQGFMINAAVGTAGLMAVATYKFRRADPAARRQMKWALFGVYCAAVPPAFAAAASALDPRLSWLWFTSLWAAPLFPLSLVVSVLRFNLFDIDRILSAAASYNILAVLIGAGALVAVPRIADAASGLVGIDPGTGQVVLSLGLAALIVPAHRRLRPRIDRVFFKDRYALDQGIAELLPTLSACSDTRELIERVGTSLHDLLRPETCVVYAHGLDGYAPVFAAGRAVPAAFATDSLLVGSLSKRRSPLSLSDEGRRPDEAPLGPFDRAALETLQAETIVPVHRGDSLAAFVCLGPKRSGDVYPATDLSLLATVAHALSQQLQRFDQEETTREAREMQESLRRYVPGAIAEQLSEGGDLSSGEREVTVLFVDIRGYTSFSESRRAEEIFSTVNRYTETVSQIVQKHGGSVVEFNGDGMMTVFGAPRELAHKERAAVEAGREIVDAVATMPVEGGDTTLQVGVGIATGDAFVGNIQAVDRMIWSAIGNTTNLAARLQGLTKDLEASIVIDSVTNERAAHAAEAFQHRPGVEIRGRRETQDLYVLGWLARAPRAGARVGPGS